MTRVAYRAVDSVAAARRALLDDPGAELIAGGTTLVDLMHCGVAEPTLLVDISRLPLSAIASDGAGLRIGALARNADVAAHPEVALAFPVLRQALLSGASAQLRNMATVGGNLLQRTRCSYYREPAARCNKRAPGAGCDARDGLHRMHAVLGSSAACIATHHSDMTAALAALDARIVVARDGGEERFALDEFYRLPADEPERETTLRRGDVVVAVELRREPLYRRSAYLKLRDRASYEFALVSVAACLELAGDGTVRDVRIALGGVATVPWRAHAAEHELLGSAATAAAFARAATTALADARPLRDNAFKVELARRAVVRTLTDLAEPQR